MHETHEQPPETEPETQGETPFENEPVAEGAACSFGARRSSGGAVRKTLGALLFLGTLAYAGWTWVKQSDPVAVVFIVLLGLFISLRLAGLLEGG